MNTNIISSKDITFQDVLSARLRLMEFSLCNSLDELLQATLDEAEALTGSGIGFYHCVSSDKQMLTLRALSSKTCAIFSKDTNVGTHYHISMAGDWSDCIHQGSPLIHNDHLSLSHCMGPPEGDTGMVREMVVPVFRGGSIVAALGVGNKPADYNQRDVDLVTILADVAWDLAERKQAEVHVRNERYRTQSYLDAVETMIFVLDVEGKILTTNRKACQILGYRESELIGHNLFDTSLPHPEGMENILTHFEKIMAGEAASQQELHENIIFTKNGTLRRISWKISLLRNEREQIFAGLFAAEDITEITQTESELFKLYQAIEQSPATIVIADLKGNIVYVNPAFCSLSGYMDEEVLGKNPRVLKSGRTSPEEYRQLWMTITVGGTWYGEFYNKKKNGDYYWEKACIAPITDKEGIICNYVAIKEDITRQKQHETELKSLGDQLLQAQKMELIGQLAGGVAHDFNNILMAIKSFSYIGQMESDSSHQIYSYFAEITKASDRGASLTRQLLAFARKQTIAPKVIGLNELVEGMMKMLFRLIGEDVRLEWFPASDLWLVMMDPAQIDQILANLCVNAKDAIDNTGTIIIKTENISVDNTFCTGHADAKPGDYVLLSVKDNGSGIDKNVLANIFEPFFTTKGVGKGTGLGLSTVYGIVKQNEGFIDVLTELNNGSTFNIYLKRYLEIKRLPEPEELIKQASQGHETIMVVEDDAPILSIVATYLETQGYTVLAASTPGEAIRLADDINYNIQLIIADVIMPEMNGRELYEALISSCPQLKCLFMSGYTSDVITRYGILDKGVNFIPKPFLLPELTVKVRTILDFE